MAPGIPGQQDGFAGDGSEVDGPVSSFQSYAAEGDLLAKQGDYRKAIDAYSKALILRPTEKNCLVARSKCLLQLGESDAALSDADTALKEDPAFFKGMFQKAEALYAKGDFEMALVFYHRGNKLRPELDEFRLGIQKAREAIDNSIGNPKNYKFKPPQNFSFDQVRQPPSVPGGRSGMGMGHSTGAKNAPLSAGENRRVRFNERASATNAANGKKAGQKDIVSPQSERNVKQLLGEFYTDKEYLENFLNDKDFKMNPSTAILELVQDGIKYLETRTEFWRQQKPIYARKKEVSEIKSRMSQARRRQQAKEREKIKERESAHQKSKHVRPEKTYKDTRLKTLKSQVNGTVVGSIRKALDEQDYSVVINLSKKFLENSATKDVDAVVQVYSLLATGFMDLGQNSDAEEWFAAAIQHPASSAQPSLLAHCRGSLGRVLAKQKKYGEAIDVWEAALNMEVMTAVEKAWLYHDIARCHMAKDPEASEHSYIIKEYAQNCLECAAVAQDVKWQLNGNILMSSIYEKTNPKMQQQHLNEALTIANQMKDDSAIVTIQRLLQKSSTTEGNQSSGRQEDGSQIEVATNVPIPSARGSEEPGAFETIAGEAIAVEGN